MGRKTIAPSQRAQPISFSLKPHLIEKIEDYANDLRFSRSKFLQEAVTQYILKADMGYMAASNNVNDMTLAQKVAVGLAALQEANREGETISKSVMDELRRELRIVPGETPEETAILDAAFADFDDSPLELVFRRDRPGYYAVIDYAAAKVVGHIEKDLNLKERPWIYLDYASDDRYSSRTLADAKDWAREVLEG